ncbi:GNAT family N-acetyltransferase [Lichenicola sp.]|uniref:GNAT family N-acetyltransferase n=1 Tax=Lichenicola sp. TaxID=2804529 RepID=UPI003AFFC4AF
MAWITPTELAGRHVTLLPLDPAHAGGLIEAASDGMLWQLWFTSVPRPEEMEAAIATRLAWAAAGTMLPFTVTEPATGRILGMTSCGHIDPSAPAAVRRLEIGWTWYAKRVQRSAVNTEAKQLLLAHAFETLGCVAVELRTHALNQASRRAIERLGAKLDGILRQHQLARDGTLRDTCVYSIIATEWPAVRSHLAWQLERPR